MEINTIVIVDKYAEYRREWRKRNKEKTAQYSRNYYHNRIATDPEYKMKLCEKVKRNNNKKCISEGKTIKSRGRPRIYSTESTDSYGIPL